MCIFIEKERDRERQRERERERERDRERERERERARERERESERCKYMLHTRQVSTAGTNSEGCWVLASCWTACVWQTAVFHKLALLTGTAQTLRNKCSMTIGAHTKSYYNPGAAYWTISPLQGHLYLLR